MLYGITLIHNALLSSFVPLTDLDALLKGKLSVPKNQLIVAVHCTDEIISGGLDHRKRAAHEHPKPVLFLCDDTLPFSNAPRNLFQHPVTIPESAKRITVRT